MNKVLFPQKELNEIAIKNKINSEIADNFKDALKKISSKEKKAFDCFRNPLQLWKYFK